MGTLERPTRKTRREARSTALSCEAARSLWQRSFVGVQGRQGPVGLGPVPSTPPGSARNDKVRGERLVEIRTRWRDKPYIRNGQNMPPTKLHIQKIVSGGQTGVDRAALDLGMHLDIPIGGWCPKGRHAEDGPIPSHYPLQSTPSPQLSQRTAWNVRDSDGTLILTCGIPTGGTALTIRLAKCQYKPCLVLDLHQNPHRTEVWAWLIQHDICILNIAGPRLSTYPAIYQLAYEFLKKLFHS